MNQRQQKPPQAYGIFSNAALLAMATRELSEAVDTGKIDNLETRLQHIDALIHAKRELRELPFVQMGHFEQSRLIDALAACLDPQKVALDGAGSTKTNAKTRQRALNLLIAINTIHDDASMSTLSSIGTVGSVMPEIMLRPQTDSAILEAYHERLIGWPPFVRQFGAIYEKGLNELYQISMRRGHGDEMTMNWVRTAKRQLHTVQFMGTVGTKMSWTLG